LREEGAMGGRLVGKVALVTGAAHNGGIGRAIALALAREGADVAINDFGREREAEEVARSIRDVGQKSVIVLADVTRVSECRRMVQETMEHFGRLDILVNNAGGGDRKPFEEVSEADYDQQVNLHLKGPFFAAQAAVRHLKAGGRGRIVNIGSEMGYIGDPLLVPYTAAKAALRSFTKSLAIALAPTVTVNTVCPGPTATERFKAGIEYTEENREKLPLKRWGRPEDVAASVLFLVSPDGDAYTGQTLDPNCGAVMP
jgi:NAD(P)-dependent dehydrogenase (short-subunit alcohol dehydrogenase family)